MTTTTKNGVNSLHRTNQAKENYLQLEREYYDLLETKHQLEQDKQHPLLGKINIRLQQLDARLKRNEASEEYYPVKDYLLENSWLVKFRKKRVRGEILSVKEEYQENRIYDLRDKVFSNIKKELVKYYQAVIKDDCRFDGMQVKDWAKEKIWRLLVRIGEPNFFHYSDQTENNFWAEKDQK